MARDRYTSAMAFADKTDMPARKKKKRAALAAARSAGKRPAAPPPPAVTRTGLGVKMTRNRRSMLFMNLGDSAIMAAADALSTGGALPRWTRLCLSR